MKVLVWRVDFCTCNIKSHAICQNECATQFMFFLTSAKRYIGEPQHTADKIEMIEPKYTGPGVPKQRRYQPKVHDYHVTPSGTAMM